MSVEMPICKPQSVHLCDCPSGPNRSSVSSVAHPGRSAARKPDLMRLSLPIYGLPVIQKQPDGAYLRHGDSTSMGLAIPKQREHDTGVSQLEWRSPHTTGTDLGGVFRIFEGDQEIATSWNQLF